MSNNYLNTLISDYKETGEKEKYIDSFSNIIIKNLNTYNNPILNEFINLINKNKIICINSIIESIISQNKIEDLMSTLLKYLMFDINSISMILDKINIENSIILTKLLFNLETLHSYKNKGYWFQKKSMIGIIIHKSDIGFLELDSSRSLTSSKIRELNRTNIYKHTNKITNLFCKHFNSYVLNWIVQLYLNNKLDDDEVTYSNQYFMFNMTHVLLNLFRKYYLLNSESIEPYKIHKISYNLSYTNTLSNETRLNVIVNLVIDLLQIYFIKFSKDYYKTVNYLKNTSTSYSDVKKKTKEIDELSTYLFNPSFISPFNFFFDTIVKSKLDTILNKKVINLICNREVDFTTKTQFNFMVSMFTDNIEQQNYIGNIDIFAFIVETYYVKKFSLLNQKFVNSLLNFISNKKINEILILFEDSYNLNFLIQVIKSNKNIKTISANYINIIISRIIEILVDFNENVVKYVPKIKNFSILRKLRCYNTLSIETRATEYAYYSEHIKIINPTGKLISLLLIYLRQLTLYFNKNLLELHVVQNMTNCFNYFIKKLLCKKLNLLKYPALTINYYKPNEYIRSMLFIYANINTPQLIQVLADHQYLDIFEHQKLHNLLTNGKNTESYITFRFSHIIKEIQKYKSKNKKSYSFPEKFTDPITLDLMETPVELPSSKIIVDMSTINNILMNKNEDPYDRSVLTKNMLIRREDIQQQIIEYRKNL